MTPIFAFDQQVAELSSFKKMKTFFSTTASFLVRKGAVHDWKHYLNEEMNRRIEKETYSRLRNVCPSLLKQWEDMGVLPGEVEN